MQMLIRDVTSVALRNDWSLLMYQLVSFLPRPSPVQFLLAKLYARRTDANRDVAYVIEG